MSTRHPSIRRAHRGSRLVRASVVVSLAFAVGLQLAGEADSPAANAHDASGDCGSAASMPLLAL
jgi:hypothetical protein